MGIENNYKNLFAPTTARQNAAAPTGGSSWETGLVSGQVVQPTYAPTAYIPSYAAEPTGQLKQSLRAIFQEGVARDLAGATQARALEENLAPLSLGQLSSLANLLNSAQSRVEQIFLLKAYAAGEPWNSLVQYGNEMRGLPEAEIIRRSTMRDDYDLIQQWQDACGPTLLQTAAGEADPRYAWELNKGSDLTQVAPSGQNMALAQQQKQWLEQFGGVAVERGQAGGQGIALSPMLNNVLSPVTKATYQTVEVTNTSQALDQIAADLQGGLDVPLRLSWSQPGADDAGHFLLAMAVRGTPGSRELQIHDPWTGRTAWVGEGSIANQSFAPIFNSYARLSHYYQPQAMV